MLTQGNRKNYPESCWESVRFVHGGEKPLFLEVVTSNASPICQGTFISVVCDRGRWEDGWWKEGWRVNVGFQIERGTNPKCPARWNLWVASKFTIETYLKISYPCLVFTVTSTGAFWGERWCRERSIYCCKHVCSKFHLLTKALRRSCVRKYCMCLT